MYHFNFLWKYACAINIKLLQSIVMNASDHGHVIFWKFQIRDHPFKMSTFFRGEAVKKLSNLPTDSSKKLPTAETWNGWSLMEDRPNKLRGIYLKFQHTCCCVSLVTYFSLFDLYFQKKGEILSFKQNLKESIFGIRIRDIHIECSKQFKWNLYFYGFGQSGLFCGRAKTALKFKYEI